MSNTELITSGSEKIEAAKGIIASIYALQKSLKSLAPEYTWSNWLGDFGELVTIDRYQLEKAPSGSKGFDAYTIERKTVQIKATHHKMIGFRDKADLMLVIHVDDNGNWSEVYFGDFETVEKNSYFSKTDKKRTIPISKLRRLQEEKGNRKLDSYAGSFNNLGDA